MYKSLHIFTDLDVAGTQTVLMNYLRYLNGDPEVNMTIMVNGCPHGSPYEQECRVKKYNLVFSNYKPWKSPRFLSPLFNWFRCQYAIYKEIRRYKPDIVHTHGTIMLHCYTIPILLSGVKKKYHTLHSDPYAINNSAVRWARFAYNKAGIFPVCVTEGQAKKAVERYGIKKFAVIKNGIDARRFKNDCREEVRKELGIKGNTFVIGCVGRFEKIKNHEFLVQVFAEYVKHNPDSLLMLVGDGREKDTIESKAIELGVINKILFTGLRSDVERVYYAMDMFMLTSHFESSSIVTVEAQFAGLRCVVSSSIPESVVVTPNVNRISLDAPIEKWVAAMNGEMKPDKMTGTLNDFSMERTIKDLKELYKKNS